MIKEKEMITKRGGESTADICMMAFRKAYHPVTEANFQPDRELAVEMNDRRVRVQDLLNACIYDVVPKNVVDLLDWWKTR